MSALGTVTSTEIVPRTPTGSSQPNLPGFYPAVYPKRLKLKRLDCLSRTRHLLRRQQTGTLDAHFHHLSARMPLQGLCRKPDAAPRKLFHRGKQDVSVYGEAAHTPLRVLSAP